MQSVVPNHIPEVYTFRCEHNRVILSHQGREHTLFFSKGLKYIFALLENPELSFSYNSIELAGGSSQSAYNQFRTLEEVQIQQLKVQENFLSIPMTDMQTIKEVKEELLSLIEELAELEENCDYARADEIRDRKDKLSSYLYEVYHKDNHIRNFNDEAKKTKRRIVRAINRALEEIASVEPELATDLGKSIKFGTMICCHWEKEIEINGNWQ